MKKNLLLVFWLCGLYYGIAQDDTRIVRIKNNLEALAIENTGLSENLKLDINVANVNLANFLVAISKVHRINMTVDPELNSITIVNNFSDVTVADLFVFLCKTYELHIGFTGNILAITRYIPPEPIVPEKEVIANYSVTEDKISLDFDAVPLERAFRKLIDISGKNLLFSQGMENIPLSLYITEVPIEIALQKLAETNGLSFSKSRDGFFVFNLPASRTNISPDGNANNVSPIANTSKQGKFYYKIIDSTRRILTVNFEHVPIAKVIDEIAYDLQLDVYTATSLEKAGTINFTAKHIYFDDLLERMFESKAASHVAAEAENSTTNRTNRGNDTANSDPNGFHTSPLYFTFKKEDNIYFFGTADQLSVRQVEVIPLMYRSIELLENPTPYFGSGRAAGRTVGGNVNIQTNGFQNGLQNNSNFGNTPQNNTTRRINTQLNNFDGFQNKAEAIVSILPDDIIADLDIKVDFELNSFLVSGPATNIKRFKKFIAEIDKPVPVVLIEVMILEVRKSATVETGISWGIGDAPVRTQGSVFPETDITLGANTVNRVIGGFDGFGSFNIGKVVPEFFATIKALEQSGNVKIRSTPKLSTLNGHRANLSIGETTYYVVTNQSFFGVQNPTSSEIRNFQPVDAELAISIKPLVSGNGQVTLDINVIQSDFSGDRIEEEAPPDLTSREFSSIIRMQNQDLAILGGLEEKVKNDSGSGVPFLARIPVLKWFFSRRVREDSKQKLTILIKPTVIY